MLRSIIVPADFGPNTLNLMAFAAGLCTKGIRRVVLAHVVDASGKEGPVIARAMDRAREQLSEYAQAFADQRVAVELRVVTGDPAAEIVVLAEHGNVDGLVCGTNAKTALTKLLSGSVSEDILNRSGRPALFVRYDLLADAEEARLAGERFGQRLVIPVDFSASATRAALMVTQLLKGAVGAAYLVHVVDPRTGLQPDLVRQGAEFQLAGACQMYSEANIPAESVVRQGDPTAEILQELEERAATGVVIGTRGHTGFQEAVLGSTSMALIREGRCPVMIVP